MSIPAYEKYYPAILQLLNDGKFHTSKEINAYCANQFNLTEEERNALLPSNRQTILANRAGWARTYLKKAGLIESPSRGIFHITEHGKKAAEDSSQIIDNEYLAKFESFQDFIKSSNPKTPDGENPSSKEETPLEIINKEYQLLSNELYDELLTTIMSQTPAFFERLVMDLLEHMGYGGQLSDAGKVTGQPGDEGIDGIIRQDALGFDKIYVQAKRWKADHAVGEPDIQQFAGALMGKGANKGLFITTSHFSDPALDFVNRHLTAKIVLIDGKQLTSLMVKYNLGVSTVQNYEIKRIDSDYFNDEDD